MKLQYEAYKQTQAGINNPDERSAIKPLTNKTIKKIARSTENLLGTPATKHEAVSIQFNFISNDRFMLLRLFADVFFSHFPPTIVD